MCIRDRYLLAFYFAHKLGHIDDRDLRRLLSALIRLPDMVAGILRQAPDIQQLAQRYAYLDHAYFIGRNLDYAVALEASLKLKAVSYTHLDVYKRQSRSSLRMRLRALLWVVI